MGEGVIDITDEAVERTPEQLAPAIEALLVTAEGALAVVDLARYAGVSPELVDRALELLAQDYEGRGSGIRLRETAGGWRLFAAPEHHELVREALRDDQPAKLTQASLETLAVVAYRQPVTRSRIGAIRGVSADAVVRTLVSRGLVVEVGVEESTGAILYGTSELFLEKLGITSLAELPPLPPYLPDLHDVLLDIDVTSM